MRRLLPTLLTTALLAPTLALGQTTMVYRPFRPGHTHTYQTNDSPAELKTVRLGTGGVVGGDSVYQFAAAYRWFDPARDTASPLCPANQGAPAMVTYQWEPNTPFGATMHVLANGEYLLRFTTGRTIRLRSRGLTIGSTWVMSSNPALTATVTQRSWQPVGTAQLPDSVVTVSISGGGQLQLSKNYGLLQAPDFHDIGTAQPTTLQLLTIPERGLGGLPSDQPIDWQPGDSVLWRKGDGGALPGCTGHWTLTRYLTRQVNLAGDTAYYTGVTQTLSWTYPGCTGPGQFLYAPQPFVRKQYIGNSTPPAHLLGQYETIMVDSLPVTGVNYIAYFRDGGAQGWFRGWRYGYSSGLQLDSCSRALFNWIDAGWGYEVMNSFGIFSERGVWGDAGDVIWYRHGTQRCGDMQDFPRNVLLHAPALLPERAVQLYPNPATTSARLSLNGTKGGALTLTVTDALGRLTWRQQSTIGADADVALPAAGWPRGTYLVRVQLPEGARTLRLVRE